VKGTSEVPWETEESAEFDEWFDKLGEDDQIQVIAAVEYLEQTGPAARMPLSYPIKQDNSCAMKELRPGSSGRSEVRILYAFDFRRMALLLLGGDKAERRDDWDSWYDRNVKVADAIFQREVARARGEEVPVGGTLLKEVSKGKSPRSKKRRQ
jgi:hypothetical protein